MDIIMKNWLSMGVAVFLIGMMLYGHYRGFIRQFVAVAAIAASIILTNLLMPQVKAYLQQNTTAQTMVRNVLLHSIDQAEEDLSSSDGEEETPEAEEPSAQRSFIENLELPEQLKRDLLTNNNHEVYELLGVDRFSDYIYAYLSSILLNGLAYILTFLAIFLGIHLVMKWLDLIAKLPILSGLNQIAGAGVGLAEGLLLIWIACLILTIFAGTSGGLLLIRQIEKSPWLSFLYENNFLIHIAMGIFQGKIG